MANQVFTVTLGDIHQGPAFVWFNLLAPADGSRMLIDAGGNPQNPAATTRVNSTAYSLGQEIWDGTNVEIAIVAGTSAAVAPTFGAVGAQTTDGGVTWLNLGVPYSLGASEGAATFAAEAKVEDVVIDQETGPVDALMISETATLEVKLKESSMKKIAYSLPHAVYSTGTDTGLPSGAQAYEQLDVGGLVVPGASLTGFAGVFPCVGVVSPRRGFSNKYEVAVLYGAVQKSVHKTPFSRSKEVVYDVKFDAISQLWRTKNKRLAQYYRQT